MKGAVNVNLFQVHLWIKVSFLIEFIYSKDERNIFFQKLESTRNSSPSNYENTIFN
jgi:hypothetical protein